MGHFKGRRPGVGTPCKVIWLHGCCRRGHNDSNGTRRATQYRSLWDVLHLGRRWAVKLADSGVTAEDTAARIVKHRAAKGGKGTCGTGAGGGERGVRPSPGSVQQRTDRHLESPGKSVDDSDGGVASAALKVADIGAVKPGLVGERFLAQAGSLTQPAQVRGQALSDIFHPDLDARASLIGLQTISDIPLDLPRRRAMTTSLFVYMGRSDGCHYRRRG